MILLALKAIWSFLFGFVGKAFGWVVANPLPALAISAGMVIAGLGWHVHGLNGVIATDKTTIAEQTQQLAKMVDANASLYSANAQLLDANAKIAGARQEVEALAEQATAKAKQVADAATQALAAAQSRREVVYVQSPEARSWADMPIPAAVADSLRATEASDQGGNGKGGVQGIRSGTAVADAAHR